MLLAMKKIRPSRPPRELFRNGDYVLSAYRPSTVELFVATGQGKLSGMGCSDPGTAVLAIRHDQREAAEVLIVLNCYDGEAVIFDIDARDDREMTAYDILPFLHFIDMPPYRESGADTALVRYFDCWYEEDANVWEVRDPIEVIAVPFYRYSIEAWPDLNERTQVLVPKVSHHDINAASVHAASKARNYYTDLAWSRLAQRPESAEHCVNESWIPERRPYVVKALTPRMAEIFSKLNREQDYVASPGGGKKFQGV